MKEDYVHGASWYLIKSIDYLEKGGNFSELLTVRRGMASIQTVVEVYENFGPSGLNYLKSYAKNIVFPPTGCTSAITISYSNAVLHAIKNGIKRVVLLESKPGNETEMAYNEYSRYAEVILVPDLTMEYFSSGIECMVVGADGVYTDGLVNKIGTKVLSKIFPGKKIAVLESFKVSDGPSPDFHEVELRGVRIPLFDLTPLSAFHEFITELGRYNSEEILNVKKKLINKIKSEILK